MYYIPFLDHNLNKQGSSSIVAPQTKQSKHGSNVFAKVTHPNPNSHFPQNKTNLSFKASSANRKLSLIYLANDVVQQSRARRKDEFPRTFGGVIAEAMEIAYRGTSPDVQNKLRRVATVWRDRVVFEPAVLAEIERRLEGYYLCGHVFADE
jgi:hypothetical protein